MATLGVRIASALGVRAAERLEPRRFHSRPDLVPPPVHITAREPGTEPGYVLLDSCRSFLDPRGVRAGVGPMILDDSGELVWFQPVRDDLAGTLSADLKVQRYRGEPVLTWWQGRLDFGGLAGYGHGAYVIVDRSYRRVGTVRAGNGLDADLHDMVITSRNTALLTAYRDLRHHGELLAESVLQEVDITTGEVLFQWNSLDHIAPDETTLKPEVLPGMGFDYLHVNSVDEDEQGNLLISARNTDALYLVDRDTGGVRWRLGGKRSDFDLRPGAGFARQHDARWLPDGTLSLFDNASDKAGPPSRALTLDIDWKAREGRAARTFEHPGGTTSASQGSHRVLPGGNSFVGWGSQPHFTEFDQRGRVRLHGTFGLGLGSYRAYRAAWTGEPTEPPAVAVSTRGTPTAYVSWNGSTEVRSWRVLGGAARDQLEPVADRSRTGFETALPLPGLWCWVAVEALGERGDVLARSEPVRC